MNFKTIAIAALLSATAASSFAKTFTENDITDVGFGELRSFTAASNNFTDTYDFSLSNTGSLAESLTNTFAVTGISSFSAVLTDITTGTTYTKLSPTLSTDGHTQMLSTFYSSMAAGDYVLTVTGSAAKGARYSVQFDSVSAVPEPASVALMLAGLGGMLFVAKRRKNV